MAAIDRAGILKALNWRYAPLLAEAGIAGTDTADGLGPVLDATQDVNDAQTDIVTTNVLRTTIARYLTLEVICERLAPRFNLSTKRGQFSLNQVYADAQKQFAQLEKQVGWIVVGAASPGAAASLVTVNAPYLAAYDGGAEW